MSRIMAIDYGDKRIGIALSDSLQIIASGYKTIINDKNSSKNIHKIILEKDVCKIVLGMPFSSSNQVGYAGTKVVKFASRLKDYLIQNNIEIPFYEQDEGYSTVNAYDAMRTIKVRKKRKQKIVDQIAAATILKDFMQTTKQKLFNFDEIKTQNEGK